MHEFCISLRQLYGDSRKFLLLGEPWLWEQSGRALGEAGMLSWEVVLRGVWACVQKLAGQGLGDRPYLV